MEEEDGAGLTGRSVAAADRPGGMGVTGLAFVDSDSRFATSSCVCRIGLVTPGGTLSHPPSSVSWSSVMEKTILGQRAHGAAGDVRSG